MPIAIVTGSSRGIGRAIALQLADDGFDVVVNDIQLQISELELVRDAVKEKGRRSIAVVADVSSEVDVKRLIKTTVEEFGELNVMVANAGIIVAKRLLEVSVEEWDRVQSINARGTFLCYREAGKQFVAQGKGGKIIGACSIAGYRPSGNALAYSASKWTVRGLTQCAALDLAEHGINVNAYCPGPIGTAMWDEIDARVAEREGLAKGEAFQRSVKARSAFGRAGEPEDIANLVSFLAGQKSNHITGQSMICDGGIAFS